MINKIDDGLDILDMCLTCISFILAIVEPTISVILGSIIYYVYIRNLLHMEVKIIDLLYTMAIALTIGYYFIPIIDIFIIKQGFDNSKITPAIGFIIGLFGEPILHYLIINSRKIVKRFFDNKFK